MHDQFTKSIISNQQMFDVILSESAIAKLCAYFELIQQHNPILHLVGPCTPEEFATRHILESLTMLEHIPKNVSFADIGSGGGLPAIPCLIVREDLRAHLIESKEKKCRFLELAVETLQLDDRATVINKQFEETTPGDAAFVSCRAIEKFTERLPKILQWARPRPFLFFGGPSLGQKLDNLKVIYSKHLMPLSHQRFLFTSKS